MANKKPLNLTITQHVLDLAAELCDKRGYSSISVLVEELLRNEHERRFGPKAGSEILDAAKLKEARDFAALGADKALSPTKSKRKRRSP